MWLLQFLSHSLGSVTVHIKEASSDVQVPRDPPDGIGAKVSLHQTKRDVLLKAAEMLTELAETEPMGPVQLAPAPAAHPVIRTHSSAPKIVHAFQKGPDGQVRSSCGLAARGPFTENLSEVTCGRCNMIIEADRRRSGGASGGR